MSNDSGVPQILRLHAARRGLALWRNNCGACQDRAGRVVRFGLGNESAELWETWKTGDLVGVGPRGLFTMVECKPPGWRGPHTPHEMAQARAIETVAALGGLAGFCTGVDDYERLIGWTS